MRQSSIVSVLFALLALASAFNLDTLNIDGIEAYLHHGYKRQVRGTGNSAAPTSTPPPSSAQPSSQEPSSQTPAPSSAPPPSSAPNNPSSSNAPSSATPAPSSNAPHSSADASSTPPPTPASSAAPKTSKTPVVTTSPLVATSVEPYTTLVVITQSDGQVSSFTSAGSRTAVITTGQALVTDPASVANDGNNSGGHGLSDTNKKVIGGVVGGVGGAILLGGLAIVAWRIWGRKNRVSEDDDDLMAGTGSALGDKPQSPNSNTPFQSNLEQYHNPGGRPNAAANF